MGQPMIAARMGRLTGKRVLCYSLLERILGEMGDLNRPGMPVGKLASHDYGLFRCGSHWNAMNS